MSEWPSVNINCYYLEAWTLEEAFVIIQLLLPCWTRPLGWELSPRWVSRLPWPQALGVQISRVTAGCLELSSLPLSLTFASPVPQRPSSSSPCPMPVIFGNCFVWDMPLRGLTWSIKYLQAFLPYWCKVPPRRILFTLSQSTVIETT